MLDRLSSKTVLLTSLLTALIPLTSWADGQPEPPPAVPEPTSWMLFGLGALGVGWAINRRRRD